MKRILLILVIIMSMTVTSFAGNFRDTQSVAVDAIETMNIVEGYGDNYFGPNDTLTRAQLCTMMIRALYGEPIYVSVNHFSDVPSTHWAIAYINTAYAYGLMEGYGDGKFGPEDNITYTQMAAVILKALGYDCSKMTWPAGVSAMAQTLGLFEEVKVVDYSLPCTRGDAAQIIYNALDLNYVNHKADYPVPDKNKTFLTDGLGFIEIEEEIEGNIYIAYQDIATKKVYVTDTCLTYEKTIYPVNENQYHFANSSKAYDINWNKIILYVNETLIEKDEKKVFAAAESALGVFDEDDKLVAIRIEANGTDYVFAVDRNTNNAIYKAVKNDKAFDEETSTVTYFNETQDYRISNKVGYGWVTKAQKSSIYVDNVKVKWDNSRDDFVKNDFVKVFYNYNGDVAAVEKLDPAYVYDLTDKVYHTVECQIVQETVRHHLHSDLAEIKSCTDEVCTGSAITINVCDQCHAKVNGNSFTLIK